MDNRGSQGTTINSTNRGLYSTTMLIAHIGALVGLGHSSATGMYSEVPWDGCIQGDTELLTKFWKSNIENPRSA